GALARRADAVVTVSKPIAAELSRTLRLRTQPLVALNAPARDAREPEPPRAGDPLRVVYQGAMGPAWFLDDLLTAAEQMEGAHLTVGVLGADRNALTAEVARRGLADRVEIAAPVPADRLVEALRPFEVGLIVHRPGTRSSELIFPNKLFEYMAAGLAVAVPHLPGPGPLVSGEQIGVVFGVERPDELGRLLTELARDRPRVAAMRARASRLARERFNAEAERAQLVRAWGLTPQ